MGNELGERVHLSTSINFCIVISESIGSNSLQRANHQWYMIRKFMSLEFSDVSQIQTFITSVWVSVDTYSTYSYSKKLINDFLYCTLDRPSRLSILPHICTKYLLPQLLN